MRATRPATAPAPTATAPTATAPAPTATAPTATAPVATDEAPSIPDESRDASDDLDLPETSLVSDLSGGQSGPSPLSAAGLLFLVALSMMVAFKLRDSATRSAIGHEL